MIGLRHEESESVAEQGSQHRQQGLEECKTERQKKGSFPRKGFLQAAGDGYGEGIHGKGDRKEYDFQDICRTNHDLWFLLYE